MSVRWSRLTIGLGLTLAGVAMLWFDARLGIGTGPGTTRVRSLATPYALGAPQSGAQDAGPLRIGIDWPPHSAMAIVPPAPPGQAYLLVHVQLRLAADAVATPVDPSWFTVRDGAAIVAHPLTPAPPGLARVLHPSAILPGQTVDGLLVYRVPTSHGTLGLLVVAATAPRHRLLWSVPAGA